MNTVNSPPRQIATCYAIVNGPDYTRVMLAIFYAHHDVPMPTVFFVPPTDPHLFNPIDLYIEKVTLDKGPSVFLEGHCYYVSRDNIVGAPCTEWLPFLARYDVQLKVGHVEIFRESRP